MKLKTRLIISFCIIVFVPMILGCTYLLIIAKLSPAEWFAIMTTEMAIGRDGLDFLVSVFVILALTASLLVAWIYEGFVPKLNKLNKAAENIKEGNLDFSIADEGTDELSELCNSFEEMRLRLLDSAQDSLEYEEEQKQLISNIAHDLKTPITSIKGYAEGIMDGVADTEEKKNAYIQTIYNKANDMNNLINELTLYSKLDTNKIPYNFNKIPVQGFFNDCASEIGMDLNNQHISLDYSNFVSDDVEMIADPEQLARVINNIISNSVKYKGTRQGHIVMTIKDVGDFVQCDIEDNGIGISATDLPYIFDRTFRSDYSRRSATGGSGIGLSIVKKIIDDHGGKIWATSTEGQGTTMSFVLRKVIENI